VDRVQLGHNGLLQVGGARVRQGPPLPSRESIEAIIAERGSCVNRVYLGYHLGKGSGFGINGGWWWGVRRVNCCDRDELIGLASSWG